MAAEKGGDGGFETKLLNCSICYQVYQSPKVLPCLHVFCYDCLSRHFILSKDRGVEKLHCPKCESVVLLPMYAKGVDSLRDDKTTKRIKEIFKQLRLEVSNGSHSTSKEPSPGSQKSKVADKNFINHVKRKEDVKKTLDNVKEYLAPMCEYLQHLYESYYYAKSNWKRELRQVQKVLVSHPEVPDDVEEKEIEKRNDRKQSIAGKYNPVVRWITAEQEVLHDKLAEIKAVTGVTKEVLRKGTYKQVKQCVPKLDYLLQTVLNIAKTSEKPADKPVEFDKLTGKCELQPKREPLEKSDEAEKAAEAKTDVEEISDPLANLRLTSRSPDPRNISVKLVAKISGKGSGPGQFNGPKSCAFAPTGDVMVSDANNFRVQVFERTGEFKGELFKGRIKPNCIRINPESHTFYVDDDNSEMLKVYSADGTLETGKIGGAYWSKGLIFHTFDRKGNVVMSHPSKCSITIHQREDGEVLQDFFFNYFEEVSPEYNPHFVTCTKEDHIVISEEKSNHVQVFSQSGQYLFLIPNLLVPRGVCSDIYGNIFVAEGDGHRISLYNRYGKLVRRLLAEKDGIRYPMSVDISDDGLLVVTQYGLYMPHEVLMFQLSYKKETLL